MSIYGILCHLRACGWTESRHFWRKVLRFLFELSCPQIALCRATQEFLGPTGSEEQTWKSFDKTSSIAHWREKQYSQVCPRPKPHLHLGLRSAPPAALHHCVTQSTVVHSRV